MDALISIAIFKFLGLPMGKCESLLCQIHEFLRPMQKLILIYVHECAHMHI